MLCTKCGQEYEGSQCPRCDGPVILVNNSDYLARRKAYEEKQALKERSASSDKKEKSQSDYEQALAKRVQTIKKQSSGKTGNKEIDFVCDKRGEKLYVQVTYLLASEETVNREFGAYDSIRDNFPKYVVSLDEFDMSRNGIKHRNIRDFLLAEEWN
jgi:hypothetical protein